MLFVALVQASRCRPLPDNYATLPLYDRLYHQLYHQRSDVHSITHIDYSARIQSVNKEINPRYWTLVDCFKSLTGYGVIVNTSFNVRGEPIVCTPEDAYRCFMGTEMDYLVMGNFLFEKGTQPQAEDAAYWKQKYELD